MSVDGDWENPQVVDTAPDTTGLTFTAGYEDGTTEAVTPTTVEPEKWANEVGEQEATFSYTKGSKTKTAKKKANVVAAPEPGPVEE